MLPQKLEQFVTPINQLKAQINHVLLGRLQFQHFSADNAEYFMQFATISYIIYVDVEIEIQLVGVVLCFIFDCTS